MGGGTQPEALIHRGAIFQQMGKERPDLTYISIPNRAKRPYSAELRKKPPEVHLAPHPLLVPSRSLLGSLSSKARGSRSMRKVVCPLLLSRLKGLHPDGRKTDSSQPCTSPASPKEGAVVQLCSLICREATVHSESSGWR